MEDKKNSIIDYQKQVEAQLSGILKALTFLDPDASRVAMGSAYIVSKKSGSGTHLAEKMLQSIHAGSNPEEMFSDQEITKSIQNLIDKAKGKPTSI